MKQKILRSIYDTFEQWSCDLDLSCQKACCSCCTQNVTLTALEAECILDFIVQNGMSSWLAEKLTSADQHQPPQMTSNDFASACIDGRDIDPGDHYSLSSCPFLDNNLCRIYPVRPFGCRLFVSTATCTKNQAAQMPDHYFEAATAVNQLIEHLGQKEYWGNMLDVLPALLDISKYREIADHIDSTRIIQARLNTLTAKPLPGFLVSKEHSDKVFPLLHKIFDTEINGRLVEDILNGK